MGRVKQNTRFKTFAISGGGVLILLILRKHTDSQLDRLQSREHKRHILVGQEELENLHEVTALSVIWLQDVSAN